MCLAYWLLWHFLCYLRPVLVVKNDIKIHSQNDTIVTGGGGGSTDTSIKRILSLGVSHTIGQSVPEADRFPNLTINWLNQRGAKVKYPAEIIARTGWTTADLLLGITNASPQPVGPYDWVTLLIGVNNQYQHRDTAEYHNESIQCLNRAIGFAGGKTNRVFVLSIPDWGATPLVHPPTLHR